MDPTSQAITRSAGLRLVPAVRRVASFLSRYLPRVLILGAVVALSFLSGGYIFSRAAPVVVAIALLALVWVWLAPRRLAFDRVTSVALAGFALLVVWTGLSIAWSIGPDLSLLAVDFAGLYLLVAVLAVGAPAGRRQLRLVVYGFVVAMVPVAVYAFLGKALPDVVTHAHIYARLSDPIGYWNVLAIMMAMASLAALEAASRRGMPIALRAASSAALGLFLLTFVFTFSRGGSLTLGVGLLVYFALTNERLSGAVSLAAAALPVAAALYHVRGLSTLFNATLDDRLRTLQGHQFGRWALAAFVVSAALQAAIAIVHRRVKVSRSFRRVAGAVVLVAAIVVVAAAGSAYVSRYGGPRAFAHVLANQLRGSDTKVQGSGDSIDRVLSVSSNGRIAMVKEGLRQFDHHPWTGTGAGTFRFTNYLFRDTPSMVVKHAHNQWVNLLSELGVVGLALFLVAIGGLLVAALRPGVRDQDRGALAVAQAASVAFVLHLSVDWDWDMAAATLAFLLLAGTAAAYLNGQRRSRREREMTGTEPRARRQRSFGVASRTLASGLLVLLAVSWIVPYLADRAYSSALVNASDNRLTQAVADAQRAHDLDPLSADALLTLALIEQQQGRVSAARAAIASAVRLQPQNYLVYYQLGLLELGALGDKVAAAAAFRHALALNPYDSMSAYELSQTAPGPKSQ